MAKVKTATRIAFKKEPEPGAPGERGPISRFRKYVTGVKYMRGAEGEEFLDYAFYEGVWYRCVTTHTPTGNRNPYDDASQGYYTWQAEPAMEFMSTGCMIVGDNGEGWILENGQIKHTSGKVILDADGSANFNNKFKIFPDGSINSNENFKVSAEGLMNSKGGVFEGRLQLPFKECLGGTFNINTGSALLLKGSLTLPNNASYNGYMLEIWGNPMISKMDSPAYLLGSIKCPHRYNGTSMFVATEIYLPKGGYVKLTCVGAQWVIIDCIAQDVEYAGEYKSSYIF